MTSTITPQLNQSGPFDNITFIEYKASWRERARTFWRNAYAKTRSLVARFLTFIKNCSRRFAAYLRELVVRIKTSKATFGVLFVSSYIAGVALMVFAIYAAIWFIWYSTVIGMIVGGPLVASVALVVSAVAVFYAVTSLFDAAIDVLETQG